MRHTSLGYHVYWGGELRVPGKIEGDDETRLVVIDEVVRCVALVEWRCWFKSFHKIMMSRRGYHRTVHALVRRIDAWMLANWARLSRLK